MSTHHRIADLQSELVRLLSPFGWEVRNWEGGYAGKWDRDYMTVFEFRFTVRAPDHLLDGQRIAQTMSIDRRELVLYANDAKFWEYLPYRWAQNVLMDTLSMVSKAKLEAKEMDWRPDGMIPEDYYSA